MCQIMRAILTRPILATMNECHRFDHSFKLPKIAYKYISNLETMHNWIYNRAFTSSSKLFPIIWERIDKIGYSLKFQWTWYEINCQFVQTLDIYNFIWISNYLWIGIWKMYYYCICSYNFPKLCNCFNYFKSNRYKFECYFSSSNCCSDSEKFRYSISHIV